MLLLIKTFITKIAKTMMTYYLKAWLYSDLNLPGYVPGYDFKG